MFTFHMNFQCKFRCETCITSGTKKFHYSYLVAKSMKLKATQLINIQNLIETNGLTFEKPNLTELEYLVKQTYFYSLVICNLKTIELLYRLGRICRTLVLDKSVSETVAGAFVSHDLGGDDGAKGDKHRV